MLGSCDRDWLLWCYWRYNNVVMMKSVVYDCVVIVMYGDWIKRCYDVIVIVCWLCN